MALSHEDYKDIKSAKGKALADKVKKATYDKPRTITLKSGEEWPVGKKLREKREKPLRSWGDELPSNIAKKSSSFDKMNAERKRQGYKPKTDRASKGLYDFLDK